MLTDRTTQASPPDPFLEPPYQIQANPNDYVCFRCGAPTRGLAFWPVNPRHPSPLDAFAANIGYLVLTCGCARAHIGASRVAVWGKAITPLHFRHDEPEWGRRVGFNARAVTEALVFLAHVESGSHGWRDIEVQVNLADIDPLREGETLPASAEFDAAPVEIG